jgi:hypothetical protein
VPVYKRNTHSPSPAAHHFLFWLLLLGRPLDKKKNGGEIRINSSDDGWRGGRDNMSIYTVVSITES